MSELNAAFAGFGLGFGLILAIGAQNAFVLKQGIRNQHVFWICLCCSVSDALLIVAGVGGFASLVAVFPWVIPITRYAGALFLFVYATLSFKDSVFESAAMEYAETGAPQSLRLALLTCLAFTWLNPHVYLDTLVLIGSISTQYEGNEMAFATGAVVSSFVFFYSLGYGSRYLSPLFAKPKAWRYLNALVGCTMLVIAITLIT